MENNTEKQLHVLSHTHWDREWYFPFEMTRIRLIRLMDKVISILTNNPDYKYFTFDGQTAAIEDYLAVKPQNKEIISRLVREGRLFIGPWYILPDEFLVSGESLIRNYLIGGHVASGIGPSMNEGYLPDMFGHTAQMPQILKGLGLESAVIWRGLSGEPELKRELYWQALDGSKVFTIHLPDKDGYINACFVPKDINEAMDMMDTLCERHGKVSLSGCMLAMNGLDHLPPEEHIVSVIEEYNRRGTGIKAIHSNLPDYMAAVRKNLPPSLQTVTGELRDINRNPYVGNVNYLLSGVLSSRMDVKLNNDQTQRLIEKDAEPLSVMANLFGRDYTKELFTLAWKYILLNHPHDNICGCSVDAVSQNMDTRFEAIREIGENLSVNSMRYMALRVDTRSVVPEDRQAALVFNTLCQKRSGEVNAVIEVELGTFVSCIKMYNAAGDEVPCKITDIKRDELIIDNYDDTHTISSSRNKDLYTVCFKAEVPAYGYSVYSYKILSEIAPYSPGEMVQNGHILENNYLKVTFMQNGSFTMLDKHSGREYPCCHYFEDGGDIGDGYTYSFPHIDNVVNSLCGNAVLSVASNNPAYGEIKVEYTLKLPVSADAGFTGRSEDTVDNRIVSTFKLWKDARRLDIKTTVYNKSRDHRLRVMFDTGLSSDTFVTDTQFGAVRRNVEVVQPSDEAWMENAPDTFPQQNFVDICDDKSGVALISKGIPECAVIKGEGNIVALTLMRCFAKMSSDKVITIKKGSGPTYNAPESQLLNRELRFSYSVYPHEAGDNIFKEAYDHNNGLSAYITDSHEGDLPVSKSFIEISADAVMVSAIKLADADENIIMRCFNCSEKPEQCGVSLGFDAEQVFMCDLKEDTYKEIPMSGRRFEFTAEAYRIYTFKIKTKA